MDVVSYLLGKKAGGGGGSSLGTIETSQKGTYSIGAFAKDIKEVPKAIISTTNANSLLYNFSGLENAEIEVSKSNTNCSGCFQYCTSLISANIINSENIVNYNSFFRECTSLVTAPNLDTSNATDVRLMFANDSNLVNIPIYDIPKVSDNMSNMFIGCTNLSNNSLNNILASCLSVEVYLSSYKTLSYIGLSQEQATICTTLSNWEALSEAGWTTGY